MLFFIESRAIKREQRKMSDVERLGQIKLSMGKGGGYDKTGHMALSEVMILSRVSSHPTGSLL